MRSARLAIVLAAFLVADGARADLVGPRDVERALTALEGEDDVRRTHAAAWLAAHGDDEVVVPRLVAALAREERPAPLVAIGLAVARRARPEDAPRLLELEPTLRAAARVPLMVALAQLGTEETDAWVVERLGTAGSADLRPAIAQVAEIARQRRDAILPRALEALASSQSALLLAWVASLEDERARGMLVALASTPSPLRQRALDALGQLGPDRATAERLREMLATAGRASPGALLALNPELSRALVAADPSSDVATLLDERDPELRSATLEALVRLAPERAVTLLGADPAAMAELDRGVLAHARAHPALPLAPWLLAETRDEALSEDVREDALEALIGIPACDVDLEGAPASLRSLARARLARACSGRTAGIDGDDAPALHLRAIAGEDVRVLIGARFPAAAREERLTLAHAWLASRLPDAASLDALAAETDPEVFEVLAAAAEAHALASEPARWAPRLADRRTRHATLGLLQARTAPPTPRVLSLVRRTLSDRDPRLRARALAASRGLAGITIEPHACAALESASRAARLAAVAALPRESPCVQRRARVDPALREWLASESSPGPDAASAADGVLVLRIAAHGEGPLPRVAILLDDGRAIVVRAPPDGLVVLPSHVGASATVLLDEEPSPSGER